ncbi:hypothetical protein PINS_up020808 [Pythium insidiosum]|nr:hypothetical protein PINS_up020808 [Pythium insidiosum]
MAMFGDAYVTHFCTVLRTVAVERTDLRHLHCPRELQLATRFLEELSPLAQHVYARVFQRKGPWFKTTSLLTYFTPRRQYVPHTKETVPGASERMNDVISLLTDDDEDDGRDGKSKAGQSQEEALEDDAQDDQEVETAAAPQSTIGVALDDPIVQHTLQSLVNAGLLDTLSLLSPAFLSREEQDAQLQVSLEAIQQCASAAELTALHKKLTGGKSRALSGRSRGSGSSPSASGNGTSKSEVFDALRRHVLSQRRIDGSRIPVAKMMHDVWRQHCNFEKSGNPDDLIFAVRLTDDARRLFLRMHRLYYFQSTLPALSMTPVLSVANRTKSFQDILKERLQSRPSSPATWPGLMAIFKKVKYPEYAININNPIFLSAEAYMCYEIASSMRRVINALEQEMVIEQSDSADATSISLPPNWHLAQDIWDNLPQLTVFQRLALASAHGGNDNWQMDAWCQAEDFLKDIATLEDFILEARLCLRVFVHYAKQESQSRSCGQPVFYRRCNAGYQLARVLHHASAIFEKQRRYQHANALLRDLLDPALDGILARKRGHWWERLVINLEHLKDKDAARQSCATALEDADVLGAARIALERRMGRLSPTTSATDFIDVSAVVDLVSSSDGEAEATSEHVPSKAANVYEYPKSFMVGRPLNRSTGERSRFIGYDDEPCTVEQLVLQHYHYRHDHEHFASEESMKENKSGNESLTGWYGVHCEGSVLTNLLGLFMWDVLYAPVPDVFHTAFQSGPLDFGYADCFYTARREKIDTLLDAIEHAMTMEDILHLLESTWYEHFGELTRFVSWGTADYIPLRFHMLVVLAMDRSRSRDYCDI